MTHLKAPGELTLSDRIDSIATHKYLALPVFVGIMVLVFFITFGPLGTWMTDGLTGLIDIFTEWARRGLQAAHASPWAVSLVCDGVITGVGPSFRSFRRSCYSFCSFLSWRTAGICAGRVYYG